MASIKKCKKIIEAGRKAGVAIWIWGAHGNGKSQIVEQVAKKLGIGFNDIRISLTEAGDWMGLPFINPTNKRMEFAPSPYLPHDIESSGILFLDELNRGRPDVTQCVFQITLDHKIGTHYELPKGWSIVAAGNPGDADYQVTDIDPALLGRFCHVHLTPTKDEWLDFAKEVGIRDDVRAFIKDNPKMLGQAVKGVKLEHVKGNPRGYDLLGKMVNSLEELGYLDECLLDVATGLIGAEGAMEYANYRKNKFKRIDVEKILNEYKAIRKDVLESVKKGRGDLGKEAIEELLLEKELPVKDILKNEDKFLNLLTFLTDLPADLGYCAAEIIMNKYRNIMDFILKRENCKVSDKFYKLITGLEEIETRKAAKSE